MRRKNWINKKNYFYGNIDIFNSFFFNIFVKKKESKFDEYNIKGQLYKTYLNKNKNSSLISELNYHFYLLFFKILKNKNKNIIYNMYVNNNKHVMSLLPSYTFKSQFFSNKSLFDDVVFNNKLRGFTINKNFYKNKYDYNYMFYKKHFIGYNFYIIKSNHIKYLNVFKILDDKEYNGVGKIKFFITNVLEKDSDINLHFLFNIFLLKTLEIYKITVVLFLKNAHNN